MELLDQPSELEHLFYSASDILDTQGVAIQHMHYFDEDEYISENGEIDPEIKSFMDELNSVVYDYSRISTTPDISADNLGYDSKGTLKAFDLDTRR